MQKLLVFNHVTVDGYIADAKGDMRWAYTAEEDTEWNEFVAGNARGRATMLFGRITYDLMAGYWPTPMAQQANPVVAAAMNSSPKVVFSRTLQKATWSNTTLVKENPAAAVRKLKSEPREGMVIFGSGTIVAQLAAEGLIDEYQIIINPVAIGGGRTMFGGLKNTLTLKLIRSRQFGNGKVLLYYEPA